MRLAGTLLIFAILSAIVALVLIPSGDPVTFCISTAVVLVFAASCYHTGVCKGRMRTRIVDTIKRYQDFLQHDPVGCLVTLQIALAIEESATKIDFGLPSGMVLTEQDKGAIRQRHAELEQAMDAAADQVCGRPEEKSRVRAPGRLLCFHRRDGLPEIPIWHEINGQWIHSTYGFPASLFPYALESLGGRLVSLDKSLMQGGNVEWIECTSRLAGNNRRFVRVDLLFEADNSVTVDLLESRIVQGDAVVWWKDQRV